MRHQDLTINHRLESFVYVNDADRLAATGFVAGDVGRIAYQTDSLQYWRLATTTPTWQAVTLPGGTGVGNVLTSGTPTVNQIGQWVDGTHIKGINVVPTVNGGVPSGGVTGSVLRKNSGTNFDTVWGPVAGAATLQTVFETTPGTASASGVMASVGGLITPSVSSRVAVSFTGGMSCNTAGSICVVKIRWNIGSSVPNHGTALTGNQLGGTPGGTSVVANAFLPFCANAVITGLTPGQQIWVDLQYAVAGGGTTTLSNVACAAFEIL